MALAKTIGIFLVAAALVLWGASKLPRLSFGNPPPQTPAAALASIDTSRLPASDDGYVTLEGTVVFDKNVSPQVPYIAYIYTNGSTRTKELIFAGKRGCETQDGDLPCVAGSFDQYPSLTPGQRIRATGTVKGDQILVEHIEPLS